MRNVATCVLGVGLGLVLGAADAKAHGGAPRAFEVLTAPGNPNDVVLRSDLWGLFRTRDGGKSWQWTCAEGYGGDSLNVDHFNMALTKGGRFFVAMTLRGLRYTDDGCTWAETAEFHGRYPVDVKTTADRVHVLTSYMNASDGGVIPGELYESTDGGDHFTLESAPMPSTFSSVAFAIAPSDPTRIYVTGRHLNTTPAALLHSTDGAKTWAETSVGLTDAFMRLRIAGVNPTRPDVVFLWGDLEETGVGINSPDELWASGDGGKTVKQVYVADGDLPGLAFSPDGTDVYLGGPTIGLLRAKVDDLLGAAGGTAFTDALSTTVRSTPNDRRVFGLRYDATGLVAGLDNFTRAGVPAIYFGSYDQSTSDFTSLMTICDANYDACGKGTSVGDVCPGIFSEIGGFKEDFITKSGRCQASTDAGFHLTFGDGAARPVTTNGGGKSGGCSVSTRRGSVGPGLSALALLGLGAGFRRRRKHAP